VERIVEQLKLMETLENRISECEKKREGKNSVDTVSDSVGTVSDSVGTVSDSFDTVSEALGRKVRKKTEELLNRVAVSELTTNNRVGQLERQIAEIGDKALALGVRCETYFKLGKELVE